MTKQNYTIISGFNAGFSSFAHVTLDRDDFKIDRDSEFSKLMNNPLKTTNGFTVGQRNRAFLHMMLDCWIDNVEPRDSFQASDDECARFNSGSQP